MNHERDKVLELSNISKSFSGIRVLTDINLELLSGQVHCLVGENGAGKSTIIKIISAAYKPDAGGKITFLGEQITNANPQWVLEHGISTIYQEIDALPELTIAENIALGNEPRLSSGALDKAAIRRNAEAALKFIGVEMDVTKKMSSLKIAHQQLVTIAKALFRKSKVIILDEPTAVFSAVEVRKLFEIIQTLKDEGIGIIYISHHLDEIFEVGDYITVIKDGYVTASGEIDEFNHDLIVQKMIGRDIAFDQRIEAENIGAYALSVENLNSSNRFSNINFEVCSGEIVGVAGLVGSGRTEIARAIVGMDSFDSGEISIFGKKVKIKSPQHALSAGLGLLPESRKEEGIVAIRSVLENSLYSSVINSSRKLFIPWKKIKSKAKKIMESVSLKCSHIEEDICYLSGGNQQKVVLSKLLAADCSIMILDEPTRGVDVGARSDIYNILQKEKENGRAILMISSDLTEILSQSDRILVMAKGRIVGEMKHEEATEENILRMALEIDEG